MNSSFGAEVIAIGRTYYNTLHMALPKVNRLHPLLFADETDDQPGLSAIAIAKSEGQVID
jgi:hypothetical protein